MAQRGRKREQRINVKCQECDIDTELKIEKSKLAAFGTCTKYKGIKYARGHINVMLLEPYIDVLHHYMTMQHLTEESNYKEMWIIRKCLEAMFKENNIKYGDGYGRGKIINLCVELPRKITRTATIGLLEYHGENQFKRYDAILAKHGEYSGPESIYILDMEDLKKHLSTIKSWISKPSISVDNEIFEMNKTIFALNKEWQEKEVPKIIEKDNETMKKWYGDKWQK